MAGKQDSASPIGTSEHGSTGPDAVEDISRGQAATSGGAKNEGRAGPNDREALPRLSRIFQRGSRTSKRPESAPSRTVKSEPETRIGIMEKLDNLIFRFARAVLLGIIAAVAGVVAAYILLRFDGISSLNESRQAELAALRADIAENRAAVETIDGQIATDQEAITDIRDALGSLTARVDNSLTETSALDSTVQEQEQMISDLEEQISSLSGTVEDLQRDTRSQEQGIRVDALSDQVSALEVAIDEAMTIAGRETSTATDSAETTNINLVVRLAEIERTIGRLRELQSHFEDMGRQSETDLQDMEARLLVLETWLGENGNQAGMAARLATVEQLLSDLPTLPPDTSSQVRQLALLTVRSAAESGLPYAGLIAATKIPAAAFPETVHDHADSGIAALEDLQAEFSLYARQLLASSAVSEDGQGLRGAFARLLRVRPLTPQDGTDPPAILSRAEDALRRNDLSGALDELADLSQPGKDILGDWIESAQTHIAVLAALDAMITRPEAG